MEVVAVPPLRRTESAPVALAAHLEHLIATGQLLPGAKLPAERALAVTMSVSRSTLREALHELETKRLLQRTPGRGTIVLGPPAQARQLRELGADGAALDHIAELREVIEPQIAGFAAGRATRANLLDLRRVLDATTARVRPAESLLLDIEFHQVLAQAGQNPLLTSLCATVSEWTRDVRAHSHTSPAGRRVSAAGHRAIYAAVEAQDVCGAQQAMANHLSEVRALIARAAG